MYWNHWFETLQSVALFYPKLAASMGAIAIANSMKPFGRPLIDSAPNQAEAPRLGAPPLLARKRRSADRKPSKARKTSKRTHSRRKAA
jgi:hypothetical protein